MACKNWTNSCECKCNETSQPIKTYTSQVEATTEYSLPIPEELGFEPGDKFTIEANEDGSLLLRPYREIEIELDDNVFLTLAKMAHDQDITFNELCNKILIQRLKGD